MINRDIQSYANSHWEAFSSRFSDLSQNDQGKSLVDGDEKIYSFDQICSSLYAEKKKPASADGISVRESEISLIEFKSGFVDKILVNNLDPELAKCEYYGGICEDYWKQFTKRREIEKDELISSICMKAIESYFLLEKQIFPLCDENQNNIKTLIKLVVVIDDNGTDGMVDILSSLSGNDSHDTIYKRIKSSLKRFHVTQDASGADYYYDDIDVISANEFKRRIFKYSI